MTEMTTEAAKLSCVKDEMSRIIADGIDRLADERVQRLVEVQGLRREIQDLQLRISELEAFQSEHNDEAVGQGD